MAGEVTHDIVILQARLSSDGEVRFRDIRGRPGIATFALSTEQDLSNAFRTRWICKHFSSIDAMLFDTTSRKAHITRGPGCLAQWKTFSFET